MTRTMMINRAIEADLAADMDEVIDLEALAEAQREMEDRAIEEELLAWLRDPTNADSEEYSDIFKEVYGFRPRW